MLHTGRTEDRLHSRRVAKDPRESDSGLAHAVFVRQIREDFIGLRILRIVNERARPAAGLQRASALDPDIFQHAVIQCPAVAVRGFGVDHIDKYPLIDEPAVQQRELKLIGNDRHVQIFCEQSHLRRVLVRNTEIAYHTRLVQFIKCLRDLRRIHQRIGSVKEQNVKMVRAKTPQRVLHSRNNIALAHIVAMSVPKSDACLALQDHLIPKARVPVKNVSEHLFGCAAYIIDTGMPSFPPAGDMSLPVVSDILLVFIIP